MNNHTYVSLANRFVTFLDNGKKLKITDTHRHIQDRTLFTWMKEELPDMDISDYSETQLNEVSERFAHLSQVVDERRKLGIKHNGLCLLIAYCLEALDENPETLQSGTKEVK